MPIERQRSRLGLHLQGVQVDRLHLLHRLPLPTPRFIQQETDF